MDAPNPYQAPSSPAYVGEQEPANAKTLRNIKAICVLYLLFSCLALLASVVMIFDDRRKDLHTPAMLMLLCGALTFVSSIAVLRIRRWGAPILQLLSAFYLFGFPVGTILGGYFLFNIGKVKQSLR